MLCNREATAVRRPRHRNEEQALLTITRASPVSSSEDSVQTEININEYIVVV